MCSACVHAPMEAGIADLWLGSHESGGRKLARSEVLQPAPPSQANCSLLVWKPTLTTAGRHG